jgi:GNAT superfamily N-acetyltransferase
MFTSMAKQRMKLDDLLVCVAAGGDDEPGAAEVGAAALWYEPGRKLSWGDAVASAPSALSCFRWGIVRGMRLDSLLENAHPSEPHYYLFAVGVRQESQGRGLGSGVLGPMLERCDDEGIAAYLENSKPRNEPFYARHGFEPLEPLPLPDGAPPLTPMLRSPR